ncbi:uncharacterized protein LOC135498699 [Lineus longissimus]|uniref:uncharacterized protein LOC135498699 n=1 Tax=Lineus longissimus TaxID=88925 RepID=UPI00315D0189
MWRITSLVVVVLVTSTRCQSSDTLARLEADMRSMKQTIGLLTGQLMMQQLAHEEKIRSDGQSGLKQSRVTKIGTKNYHSESHTGFRHAAIHNHANHIRTAGMGEVIAVLNGVEFKTRHNDFQLKKPVENSKAFREVENIPFPDVPPEVLSKATLTAQIAELREWFKAWRDSDHSTRDYRKYFKPNLCYLEGYWTIPDGSDKIDEPFDSERHALDATSWHDLLQKIRFSAYSGRKDAGENFAYLPTKITEFINGSIPVYAQWGYRINCHPLKTEVPHSAFRLVDDLASRKSFGEGRNKTAQLASRAARFQINPRIGQKWYNPKQPWWEMRMSNREFMDTLMGEIPGLDNYGADLVDDAFNYKAIEIGTPYSPDAPAKNVAYYHRFYKEFAVGAMGVVDRKRSYSDESVFMAMNTQPQVAPSNLNYCKKNKCTNFQQRWSYAIPIEIIYTTPLSGWNPYNLAYHGFPWQDKISKANGRNGGFTSAKAYNGTGSATYYITPEAFFDGGEISQGDQADTAADVVGVLDPSGAMRRVKAAGVRIHLPDIPGVGTLRQRYPIAPIHGEGSPVWKELDALKDIVLAWRHNIPMFYDDFDFRL